VTTLRERSPHATSLAATAPPARSGARVGIRLEEGQFDEPWLVVHALMQRDMGLSEVSNMLCDPARPITLIPGPQSPPLGVHAAARRRPRGEMQQPETIHQLLSRWAAPEDLTIVRAAVYRFHSLVAWEWRSGSIFLAGDAAHQTPPFLGRGMCHGIRDVQNLIWNLALVLQRGVSPAVLDTYQAERRSTRAGHQPRGGRGRPRGVHARSYRCRRARRAHSGCRR
jgi:3-(3-hydroxy-phenyl)propionate hydroxylase